MTAIQADAAKETELGPMSETDAGEELLRRFLPPEEGTDASKKKPSAAEKTDEDQEDADPKAKTDDEDPAEKPGSDDDGEDEGKDEEQDEKAKKFAEEADTYVKIKVGDEEHEVPVTKLTRLYGQEAALTKKSMEVAEQRKTVDAELTRQAASSAALLERAKVRFEPYSKLDFNLLATQLPAEDYTALRQSAQAAWEDVQFLEQHQTGFMQALKEREQSTLREKAVEAIKVLSGPADKGGIEGWSQKVYDDIRTFAVAQGAPAELINQVVDPWAIRMMHDAMLFARGRAKSGSKVETVKVNKTPKKITKTTHSPSSDSKAEAKTADKAKAMKRLQTSGSPDDAVDAFLAGWKKSSSDD